MQPPNAYNNGTFLTEGFVPTAGAQRPAFSSFYFWFHTMWQQFIG
jgi:hypothetical protein